jgi:ABC-type amino acid transport substrate-binding protein
VDCVKPVWFTFTFTTPLTEGLNFITAELHKNFGPIFRPIKYGIAVKNGNPQRKKINEALLQVYDNGTYEDIYNKWFSLGK